MDVRVRTQLGVVGLPTAYLFSAGSHSRVHLALHIERILASYHNLLKTSPRHYIATARTR